MGKLNKYYMVYQATKVVVKGFVTSMYERLKKIVNYLPLVWVATAAIYRMFEDSIMKLLKTQTSFDFMGGRLPGGQDIITNVLGHGSVITSGYGVRHLNGHDWHGGIDIRAPYGSPIAAPFDGRVVSVRKDLNDKGGRNVTVESKDGLVRVFMCHLSDVGVHVGDDVRAHQIIAHSGASGNNSERAYDPHLHLEVKMRGSTRDAFRNYDPATANLTDYLDEGPVLAQISTPMPTTGTNVYGTPTTDKKLIHDSVAYFMTHLGVNSQQAAGLVGNFLVESGLKPTAYNSRGGGHGAQGIAQWRGARVENFKKKFGKEPKDDPDINHHLEFVVDEMNKTRLTARLKECGTVDVAAKLIFDRYERPQDSSLPKRMEWSRYAWDVYMELAKKVVTEDTKFTGGTFFHFGF